MKPIITRFLILATSVVAHAQEAPGIRGIAELVHPASSASNPPPPPAVTESTPQKQAENPAVPPGSAETLRFTVELTDGSRFLGSPVNDSFRWKTGLGVLTLEWNRLKAVERVGGGEEYSIVFRNEDHAAGTPEANTLTLRTLLGDLAIPLALTRRIRVESLAGGSGPAAYWSFDDPKNLGADDSGHDHTLTLMGALPTDGRIGNAAATREHMGQGGCLVN